MVPKPKSSIQTSFTFFSITPLFSVINSSLSNCQIFTMSDPSYFSDLFFSSSFCPEENFIHVYTISPQIAAEAYPQISLVLESFHPIHSVLLSEHHS